MTRTGAPKAGAWGLAAPRKNLAPTAWVGALRWCCFLLWIAACGDPDLPQVAVEAPPDAQDDAQDDAHDDAPSPDASEDALDLGDAGSDASEDALDLGDAGSDTSEDVLDLGDSGSDTSEDVLDLGDADSDAPTSDADAQDADADAQDASADADSDAGSDASADADADAGADADADADAGGEWPHVRPVNLGCVAPTRPPNAQGVRLTPVFLGLRFTYAVAALQAPGDSSRWYVVEQQGFIRAFDNVQGVNSSDIFLDLSERVACCGERGLLGMAFHPRFPADDRVFLFYTHLSQGNLYTRVSSMRLYADGVTYGLDPGSEEVLLDVLQPYSNHNGGTVAFGPDGFLYVGLGDGGSSGDPQSFGQDVDELLGSMLRLDVDAPAEGERYGIPADNPFAQGGGAPEIYAWGLRNPWKFSFDPVTGWLWAGDVGQNAYEEINLITLGGNYGWNVFEGDHCYRGSPLCDTLQAVPPILEYRHAPRASVTGGYVYRGQMLPEFVGRYLYGDYVTGQLWAASYDEGQGRWVSQELLDAGFNISSFAQDADGEVYALYYGANNVLYRVEPALPQDDRFPRLLSQTGCVRPEAPSEPAEGLIPYEINAPFWSDGADKERWLAVPEGSQLEVEPDGDLVLPVGAVTVKHFRLGGRLIETRLLVRHDDGGWAGYSYAWDEAQTDATLLDAELRREVGGQTWRHPSRAGCAACHNQAAGSTLGLELAQLDREARSFRGEPYDQLGAWAQTGLLRGGALPPTRALSLDPGAQDLGWRARSYLHSNCAYCHRPGGPGRGSFDLRASTPAAQAGFCDAEPEEGELGVEGARVVAPGDVERSLVWLRMARLDEARMPSSLSTVLDQEGLGLLQAWIESLGGCDDVE